MKKSPSLFKHRTRTGTELGAATFKVLFGIAKAWNLSQAELANILHRSPRTVSRWRVLKTVLVSAEHPSPNDFQIFELIEFYDAVSSFFVRVEDQVGWLKTPSSEFAGRSPLELLELSPRNLYALREWVENLAR